MTWKRDRVSLSKEQVTANFYVEPDPLTHLSESDYGIGLYNGALNQYTRP